MWIWHFQYYLKGFELKNQEFSAFAATFFPGSPVTIGVSC